MAKIFGLCEYPQKTPYTGQCWDDSCWQERQPLSEIPASLYLTSVNTRNREQGNKGALTLTVNREVCVVYITYSRYANLLDDILVPILFGFDKDSLPKGTFPNFLHLFVLVHVSGMTGSSCWVCKWIKGHYESKDGSLVKGNNR